VYGSWPQQSFFTPQQSSRDVAWQPSVPPHSYMPGPGAAASYGQHMRTGSMSSYNSHSSHRFLDDERESPIFESDEDYDSSGDEKKHARHRRHTHSGSSGHHHHKKMSWHGDRAEGKYSGRTDHASLGDTLALIWDG